MKSSMREVAVEYDRKIKSLEKQIQKAGDYITDVATALGASTSSKTTVLTKILWLKGLCKSHVTMIAAVEKAIQVQADEMTVLAAELSPLKIEKRFPEKKKSSKKKSSKGRG